MLLEAILPLFVVALPAVLVLITLRFIRQQTSAKYETLVKLADRGVELPMALLMPPSQANADRRRGVILICGGLGLMISLAVLPDPTPDGVQLADLWGMGLLPIMLGVGYLANWWLERGTIHEPRP